jgi:hypothetical protein
MTRESIGIPVDHARVEEVSARLDLPDEDAGRSVLLLAHGAGAPMDSDFLEAVATGLARTGLAVLRFNYAYAERMQREGRRLPPDRRPVLEGVHGLALELVRERFPERRLILAGKSMGGRIASYLAAEGAGAEGLCFLGYPLHPARKPERLRSEHFPAVALPALFLQGTRDPLCGLELLADALETFGGRTTLHVVEGADHDFKVPRRSGRERSEVIAELVATIAQWELATFPG